MVVITVILFSRNASSRFDRAARGAPPRRLFDLVSQASEKGYSSRATESERLGGPSESLRDSRRNREQPQRRNIRITDMWWALS